MQSGMSTASAKLAGIMQGNRNVFNLLENISR
jgi:hypothetical protein